jgi:hypothetical protein
MGKIFWRKKIGKRFWGIFGLLLFLSYLFYSYSSRECHRGRRDDGRKSLEEEMSAPGRNVFIRPREFEEVEKGVEELNRNVIVVEGGGGCTRRRRPLPHEILFSNTYWQVIYFLRSN